ncbi:bifunctional (p)ppGpp synthetase/guanosine-3',5'-bis(diphosphate) 3'-pyrophosphohydrolase [Falsarthrobacter nasiphocae]|nr:bifunctional (p)ppGpp synthetase/guanosine-3',5'-bis(diphosphate) 3'-pyrophosphohydrolase [Falsarthrobacter nasiphocae]
MANGVTPSPRERRPSVLSPLARLAGRAPSPTPILDPLLRQIKATSPKADLEPIRRAYAVAERLHEGQKRRSGDPYITHPVAVASILAQMGFTGTTLQAALLHDTVEDTDYSLEELTAEFSAEVAMLVDGVTKLDKVTYGDATQAETVRKMVIAMSSDIRVLIIKLADRLHNARTWRYVSSESAAKKARETLEIFAPLAHRLGMNTVKWELEDLSFAVLYPKRYEEIVRLVGQRTPEREKYLAQVREAILADLHEARIRCTVTGRPKHYYSVYQKMIVRGKEFDEIHDLTGIRILVDSVRDCYATLGIIHNEWSPMPGRFKDYIASPKFNLYQSLHTSVIGPGGRPVEFQIRTHEMHRRAEYGIAAHWKYKQQPNATSAQGTEDMRWLKSLMDWQQETRDASEFLESLRYEMNAAEVYVFTPKGDIQALPAGSTPVDFAYTVHTDVGHRTIGARVNGRLMPLSTELKNGDWVEIVTSKAADAGPSRDWLSFVKSGRAKSKIRHWFSRERREESIEAGRDSLTRALRKRNLPIQKFLTQDKLQTIAESMGLGDINSLFAAIGEGTSSPQSVIQSLESNFGETDLEVREPITITAPRKGRAVDGAVAVQGDADVWIKLAKCCTPVPPDPILGFVTRGKGVSIHRRDCTNAESLLAQEDRLVPVAWTETSVGVFLVEIQVEALDRKNLLSDVTRVLSDHRVNILAASVQTSEDRIARSRFSFEMTDPRYLDHVLSAVRRIDGVYDVYRMSGNRRQG